MKRVICILLLLLSVVAGGIAWRATLDGRSAEAQLAQAQRDRATLAGELDQAKAQLLGVEMSRSELQKQITVIQSRADSKPDGAQAASREPALVIQNDPKLHALYLASTRAALSSRFRAFFQAIKLSSGETETLLKALLSAEEARQNLDDLLRQRGLPSSDPSSAAARKEIADRLDATVQDLLGSEGATAFQNYKVSLPARDIVGHFAAAATLAELPLTHDQGDQLTAIISQSKTSMHGDPNADKTDWAAVDVAAQRILTPDQYVLFRRIEPVGGGPSRFSAQLSDALKRAGTGGFR